MMLGNLKYSMLLYPIMNAKDAEGGLSFANGAQ